ncbi:MAG TPA: sugar transferase [Geminicoccaceae bacterium]|nr:sugar transferase [Geminicoccaceae bacterium]
MTGRAKRALDLLGASAGLLLLLAPAALAVALAVKLDDGGPVFFRQTRIGRHGVPFRIWKFRTMVVDAGRRGGPLTVGRDPRVTRVGRVLRRTKLDELPQLLNVLAGGMSLVGPRPELPEYVRLYTPGQRRVLDLMPGMTDPASIAFRHEADLLARAADPERFYVERIMPEKIRLNLAHAARGGGVPSDLRVILATAICLLR